MNHSERFSGMQTQKQLEKKMVSLCFSGPTCKTHFTPWHQTLQLNQKQFCTHNFILLVVCGWPFFLALVNSKEKNTGENSWFCYRYRITQKDHRKCLLRACNFSNEVFINCTRKFSRFIDLYWSRAGPTQTQSLHRYQHFPKMSTLCWTFETKSGIEELEDGLNLLCLPIMQLTSAQGILWVIQCISSCTQPPSPFPPGRVSGIS